VNVFAVRDDGEHTLVMKPTNAAPTARRPLVQWISRNTAPHGRDLEPASPIGAIATSVIGAAHLGNTLSAARRDGRGVLVDTEAWREQLEPDDDHRSGEFRRLGLELDPNRRLRPSEDALAPAARSEFVARHRNTQIAAGGSILLSPYHRVREEDALSRGRLLDLALAHEFVELAETTGAVGGPGTSRERSVAVGIAVDASTLTMAGITELISGYREVRADLFWIWVWSFTSSKLQYERVHTLATGLQAASSTPCLVGGLGRLWEAAMRNGVAAACQGWGRTRMPFPPPQPPGSVEGGGEDSEDDDGWGVHAFHRAIRGTTKLGPEHEEPLRRLFSELPCECGHHIPDAVPHSQPERHAHNRAAAEELVREIAALGADGAREELGDIVAEAESHRARLELGVLHRGWHAAADLPATAEAPAVHADIWLRKTG
jgi:hypothetical protein